MADDKRLEDLVIDPIKSLKRVVGDFAGTFKSATDPVVSAQKRLTGFQDQLASLNNQYKSQQAENAQAHQEMLASMNLSTQERADVERKYQESVQEARELQEKNTKYLEDIIKSEEEIVNNFKELATESGGLSRLSAGANKLNDGIKGLSFGLVDLGSNTGKLTGFFQGLQDAASGLTTIVFGAVEALTALVGLGILKEDTIDKIKDGVSGFFSNFSNMGEGFREKGQGFLDGLFGKKKIDKGGRVRDKKGFAKGDKEGVGAGASVFTALTNPMEGFKKSFLGIFGKKGIFAKIFTTLKAAGAAFLVGAKRLLKAALTFAATTLITLGGMLLAATPFILIGIAAAALAVLAWQVLKKFDEQFPWFFDTLAWFFGKIYEFGKLIVGSIWDGIKSTFSFITSLFEFDEDTSLFGRLIDIVYMPLNMAINFIKGVFGWGDPDEPFKLSEFLWNIVTGVWDWIKGIFGFAKEGMEESGGLMSWLGGIAGRVWDWIKSKFGFAREKMIENSEGFMSWLSGIGSRAWDWIKSKFGFDKEKMQANAEKMNEMVQAAWNKVQEWWGSMTDKLKNAWSDTKEWFGDKWEGVKEWGSDLIDGKEKGGPVSANTPYMVGEAGPEVFQPSTGGRIIPNDSLGFTSASNVAAALADMISVRDSNASGGGTNAVSQVLSMDNTSNQSYNFTSGNKTTSNDDAILQKTAMIQYS